ncbi:hypothetical protein OJAV_G00113650 [Oryzias javanicus]|uniref:C-type lectin domain-containing protein n=1 Tax=Oryzias javanicus TaxID=123683 RepID=A0A437CWS6_ORYJA|nr:hypothetical protein OJAV_G00113650 [Oryzias javanicus]
MSSDIYARQDFSKNVRYNRKQQEDSSDWEECEVTISNEAYKSVESTTDIQSPEQAPQTEMCPKVQKRCCRCDKWCLLVLCTVLSAVIIVLSSSYMVFSISNQQKDVKNKFEVNISNLQKYLEEQINKFEGQMCPELWMRFRSSCYYKSIEKKNWTDSRSFCQDEGADLLVINSREEQEFVFKLTPNKESWIGLSAEGSSPNDEWRWVDGSPLTQTFWDETLSRTPSYNHAVVLSDEGKWTQQYNTYNKNWICEK